MKSKIVSFVVAEGPRFKKAEGVAEIKATQSAPQYYESVLPKQFIVGEEVAKVKGQEVKFLIKAYPPEVLLVEASVDVLDIFSADAFELRESLIDECHKILKSRGAKFDLSEEYSLAVVSDYQGDPEQFFDRKAAIAGFLKSEKLPLDESEIEYALSRQLKYAKDDLVIVDWDGAFVFDPKGEVDSAVDLFQTANLQLLRYRMLDFDLDNRLRRVSRFAYKPDTKLIVLSQKEMSQNFREMIKARASSISEFEALERDIKLIGDWYSARLYDLVSKKFKIDEWRQLVQDKLESLGNVYNIVAENFSISRHQFLELAQIILFFILQAGWFVLIILELFYYTR